ncbi:MAG: hypothetical protein HKN30_04170 [Sulfitobacter sp.]|nr:hypothetical protein [Sulfitobacter sp.]
MTLTITPLYAAALTLLFFVLSWRVIRYRRANQISLGDNDDKNLRKRMRAQANFVEYTPLALILLLIAELQGAPGVALHVMGLGLLTGRLLHAYGFASTPQNIAMRQAGMGLTFLVLLIGAVAIFAHALF